MGRFGLHCAPAPQPGPHFLDKMGGGGNFRHLALGYVEPGPGERRLDLCAGHGLRFHDALSLISGVWAERVNPKAAKEKPMNGSRGWRGYSVRLEGAKYGASFGSALAMAISYNTNHSILWAIVHGIFSWIYVVYFALFYG
jgi:hypothetical protein